MSERIVIVGAGVMGENHARTLKEHKDAYLSHVIDPDLDRARSIAAIHGDHRTVAIQSIEGLDKNEADAAIIVSPSRFHEEQAVTLMESGLGVLIEKPVAETEDAAHAIDRVAKSMGAVAMVGHIELFNPTVNSLMALVKDDNIREMAFDRLGKVSDQNRLYHDVVSDLMIHDLSIALKLLETQGYDINGTVISAIGRSETCATPDPARASVRFGEVDVHLRASRAFAAGKVRRAIVETTDNIFTADLLSRTITSQSANDLSLTPEGVIVEDVHTTQFFPRDAKQPLVLEQAFFVDALRGNVTPEDMGVSILQAARTLKYSQAILNSIQHQNNG